MVLKDREMDLVVRLCHRPVDGLSTRWGRLQDDPSLHKARLEDIPAQRAIGCFVRRPV